MASKQSTRTLRNATETRSHLKDVGDIETPVQNSTEHVNV